MKKRKPTKPTNTRAKSQKKRRKPPGSGKPTKRVTSKPTVPADNRKQITFKTGDLFEEMLQILRLLLLVMGRFIFRLGANLVRAPRQSNPTTFEILNARALHHLLHARYKFVNEDGGVIRKLEQDIFEHLLSTQLQRFPEIDLVARYPIVTPSGKLLTKPGYDDQSRIFLAMEPLELNVPESPTLEEAQVSLGYVIDEVFGEFPFVGPADLAHVLAGIFTAILRPLIPGSVPIIGIDATTPGAGKTLIVEVIYRLLTGLPLKVMTLPTNEDEMRKALSSLLRSGQTFILFDNARDNYMIASAVLASAVTAGAMQDRRLGTNEMFHVKNNAQVFITANGLRVSKEIGRRTAPARLEPQTERPQERKFKRDNLKSWVGENRLGLLEAILTVVAFWLSQGMPGPSDPKLKSFGSFEGWRTVIGGLFELMGVEGFLANLDSFRERSDRESEEWREFVKAWADVHKKAHVTTKQLYALVEQQDLLEETLGDRGAHSRKTRLGMLLDRRINSIVLGARIVDAGRDGTTKGRKFALEPKKKAAKKPKAGPRPKRRRRG